MISRSHFCTVGDRCVVVFFLSVSFFLSFSISFSHTRASQSIKIEVKGKRQPSSRRISHVSIVPRFTVVPFRPLSHLPLPTPNIFVSSFLHLFTLSLFRTLLRRASFVSSFVRLSFSSSVNHPVCFAPWNMARRLRGPALIGSSRDETFTELSFERNISPVCR